MDACFVTQLEIREGVKFSFQTHPSFLYYKPNKYFENFGLNTADIPWLNSKWRSYSMRYDPSSKLCLKFL